MDILKQISEKKRFFSKGQKKIAEYIENHADKAAFMTAAKLGVTVGVSESTVVRFACELGFNGFPEMSRALQQTVKTKLTSVQRIAVTKERIGDDDILNKVLISDMEKIKKTLEETSKEDFNTAANAIANARNIYIIGDRSASALARFMAYYFNLMFDNVRMIHTASVGELYEQVIRLDKTDVLIGISFPRYSNLTVKAFEFASKTGAPVVAITDGVTSPLAKDATVLLAAKSDMTSFVDSLVAPLSLINALIAAVGLIKQDEVTKTFDHLENIWAEYGIYKNSESEE